MGTSAIPTLPWSAANTIVANTKLPTFPAATFPVIEYRSPMIYAHDASNIALTGSGVLDASGTSTWNQGSDRAYLETLVAKGIPANQRVVPGSGHQMRSTFVEPHSCDTVLIQGVTLHNSRFWQLHPTLCTNVTVGSVTTSATNSNTDGCDPECCDHVVIQNCTVGLRVEPGEIGTGVQFRLKVELGSMPYAFFKAVEDTVHETLRQGLHGWQVTDCVVTMTHSGYWPRQSHAHQRFDKSMSSTGADFRGVTPLVVIDALRGAGTRVYEPVHRFRLDLPADSLGPILPILSALRAVPQTSRMQGPACLIEGEIPVAQVHALERQLPGLTGGEGVLEYDFDHYQQVRGEVPERPRSDHNPLDRKEYLLHVQRRV